MIKKISLLFILLSVLTNMSGQQNGTGIPLIINYEPEITHGSEVNWAVIQDDRGVLYVGNDDKSVLEYDGNEWRQIPIPNTSSIRSLAKSSDGTIYVGAVKEFGYLAPDIIGDLHYISLIPLLDSAERRFTDIWKTYALDDKVIFYSEQYIFIYHPGSKVLDVYDSPYHALFGFYIDEKFYCGTFNEGLVEILVNSEKPDSIVHVPGGNNYIETNIFGLASYDSQRLLIGAQGRGLTLLNIQTGDVKQFGSKNTNDYLSSTLITHILNLQDGNFMISTMGAGLIVVTREGDIKEIISRSEGLQDQVAFSSFQNTKNYPYPQTWSALSIGVSKTEISSPFRILNEEFGYTGGINKMAAIDEILYIGTSTGLYRLNTATEDNNFEKVGSGTAHVWDFQEFRLDNGEKVLLGVGADGLQLIHKNGTIVWIDDILLNAELEEKELWGYAVLQDPFQSDRIFIGRESAITCLRYKNGKWYKEYIKKHLGDDVRTLAFDDEGMLWLGTKLAGIARLNPNDSASVPTFFSTEQGLPLRAENNVYRIGEELLIGTINGIFRLKSNKDSVSFERDTLYNKLLLPGMNMIQHIYKDPGGSIWISYRNSVYGWKITYLETDGNGKFTAVTKPFFSLPDFSCESFISLDGKNMWFSISNNLYIFDKENKFTQGTYTALVRKVTVNEDSVIFNGTYPILNEAGDLVFGMQQDEELIPDVKHRDNNIEIRWSAPYFDQEDKIEFSYFLEGFSKSWSTWETVFYKDFTNLPHGNYTFRIKARNIYMDESLEDSFSFVISRPWYLTFIAFLAYLILAVLIVYIIIALYTKRLKNENIRLEGIIQDRTAEIRKQKEELTDSIEYASRIQRALLPPEKMLDKYVKDHFILFKPRDIVSGDFYWFGVQKDKLFIVAADCTGHGVPGAFMSMLGISFLDEIVIKSGVSETNKVLDALRNHVITSLRQTGQGMDESTKDGMDLAMITIDQKTNEIQYSGAYNPLYAIRELTDEEKSTLAHGIEIELDRGSIHNDTHLLFQVKADLMPIGISEKDFSFSATTLKDLNASIYLFSDGYVDQFGGPSGKKLMSKNFKKLLLDLQGMSMDKQLKKLEDTLKEWMGDISQIDDILVIGIKLGD